MQKSNDHVIFDLQNEPHDIPASTVFALMQAGVNGVRAAGATSQLILVEGTSWTGAWTWVSSGNSAVFGAIKDPNNNVAIRACPFILFLFVLNFLLEVVRDSNFL